MFNSDDETEKDFGVNMTTEVVDGKTYYKCTEEKKVVKTIRNALDNSDEYCQKCGIEAEDFC